MTGDPAYIDTLADFLAPPNGPNWAFQSEVRAALRALVADAVRQARTTAPWPTCAKCGSYGHVAINCAVTTLPSGDPRAQAEARLRDDLRRALIDWINIESPFVVIGPPDAQQRARHDLRRAVEAILAAPPEPQAPPPDRAAWREDAIATIVRSVAELPDRASPEDWPDAMLVTPEELHDILMEALDAPLRWPVAGDEGLRGGMKLIAEERRKQIDKWGERHDSEHDRAQLAIVAAILAIQHTSATVGGDTAGMLSDKALQLDAWGLVEKHHSQIEQLTIAGALIAAEIDRLLLARAPAAPPKEAT